MSDKMQKAQEKRERRAKKKGASNYAKQNATAKAGVLRAAWRELTAWGSGRRKGQEGDLGGR